jgi:hypothetical protein
VLDVSAWWSWLLTAVGVTGLYFAGRKMWQGWIVGLSAQVLWVSYAIATKQWGFIVSAFAYGSVYGRNAWLWWNDHKRITIKERDEELQG